RSGGRSGPVRKPRTRSPIAGRPRATEAPLDKEKATSRWLFSFGTQRLRGQPLLDLRLGRLELRGQALLQLLEQFMVQLQLLFPGRQVDVDHLLELLLREGQAFPVQFLV